MFDIWFWQTIVSPHMAGLAAELSRRGCAVTYVAQDQITADRLSLGWKTPPLGRSRLLKASNKLAVLEHLSAASSDSIHVCQGLRGNGIVRVAQARMVELGLRQWTVMETVDDSGPLGWAKRFEYQRLLRARKASLQGILATGYRTVDWLIARGVEPSMIYPFTYFLPELTEDTPTVLLAGSSAKFIFLYVGQLVAMKRVDLLLTALGRQVGVEFELWVVGDGPEMAALRQQSEQMLRGRVRFMGTVSADGIPSLMASADCLVLPSRHDGWGVVVSEALMNGTPAICSDACGCAGVVRASRVGGVFPSGDFEALGEKLSQARSRGKVRDRQRRRLASWALALGAKEGANYMISILEHAAIGSARPNTPWLAKEEPCAV